MYSFSFICRESKVNKRGLAPVELVIIINKKRTCIALPLKYTPDDFKVKTTSAYNNELQEYISAIRIKLNKYIAEMTMNDVTISAESLKEYFKNGGVKTYYLQDLIEEFLLFQSKNTSEEAVYKYRIAFDKLLSFMGNVELRKIKCQHFEEFRVEYKNKGFEQSTLAYLMGRVKALFTFAEKKGYIQVNEMNFIKINKKAKPVQYLTNEEFDRIRKKDFKNERLNKVRDLFIFQCETATAFTDACQISFLDLKKEGNIFYVEKKRQKTGVEFFTILSPIAMEIFKKYNYNMNIISNQKCNAYLKEIADICKIDKPLHTHIARHTGATRLLNAGFPVEVVARVMGHSNISMTQHYAKITDKTVINTYKQIKGVI